MQKRKIYIQQMVMCIAFVLSSSWIHAQLTAKVGDTTILSVGEVPLDTYAWELYDAAQGLNFATTSGNCPTSKAQFVSGNTGTSVQIQWLVSGEYFYKVTAQNSCASNIKIGRIIVLQADIPPPPTVTINYNCESGTAELTASNYHGTLLWSTGETSEKITVVEAGVYTVVQVTNRQQSAEKRIEVGKILPSPPTNVTAIPPKIEKGGHSALTAEGCENGILRWYKDENLTQELMDTQVTPDKTTTYYVVCENEIGCKSVAVPVTVTIDVFDASKCSGLYKNITIAQLLSPNGDGYNDTWELNDVLTYCKECKKTARVKLFNRWGAEVYDKKGYMLDEERFDGHSKNGLDYNGAKLLPAGTYFYIISVEGEKEKTGYINIVHSE